MFRLYLTPYEEELCIKIKESVQILRPEYLDFFY